LEDLGLKNLHHEDTSAACPNGITVSIKFLPIHNWQKNSVHTCQHIYYFWSWITEIVNTENSETEINTNIATVYW